MGYTVIESFIASYFLSPIPETRVISFVVLNGPFFSRSAMIFFAVASPIPDKLLSPAISAVLIFTSPPGALEEPAPEAPLLAVAALPALPAPAAPAALALFEATTICSPSTISRQVHASLIRVVRKASCCIDSSLNARSCINFIKTRIRYFSHHMD